MSLERATSQPMGQVQQKLYFQARRPSFSHPTRCPVSGLGTGVDQHSEGHFFWGQARDILSFQQPCEGISHLCGESNHPCGGLHTPDGGSIHRHKAKSGPALTTTLRLSVPRFGPRQTDHWGQSYQFNLFLSYSKADTAAFPCCGKAPKDQVLSMTTILQDSWFSQEKSFIYNHEVWRVLLNPIMYLFTTTSKLLVINFQGKSCL